MGVVLDTTLLIGTERGTFPLVRLLRDLDSTPIAISAITASELLHGTHRASDAATQARRSALTETFLRDLPVLPFDLLAARQHAVLWAMLASRGTLIGSHDLMIAATALASGYALATLNTAEFGRVPGLRLIPLDGYQAS